ncbi:hypothetical protein [Niallia sp. Krafla_26]|uniref:hypothetical protein n=1 Tax=Niallia sp. Krafla_26 TaxID=3064703 RepID=UPI003D1782AE
MSMAQFDDVFEICCGHVEDENVLPEVKKIEEIPVTAERKATPKWWEDALKEIEKESENEYELYYL